MVQVPGVLGSFPWKSKLDDHEHPFWPYRKLWHAQHRLKAEWRLLLDKFQVQWDTVSTPASALTGGDPTHFMGVGPSEWGLFSAFSITQFPSVTQICTQVTGHRSREDVWQFSSQSCRCYTRYMGLVPSSMCFPSLPQELMWLQLTQAGISKNTSGSFNLVRLSLHFLQARYHPPQTCTEHPGLLLYYAGL